MTMVLIASLTVVSSPKSVNAETVDNEVKRELSHDEAAKMANSVNLSQYQESSESIDKNRVKGWELSDGTYYVGYGFQGNVEPVSQLGAVVSSDITLISTNEVLIREISDSSGSVKVWSNGELSAEQVVTDEDAEAQIDAQAAGFWTRLEDCLNSQGISTWTATALSIACGAACAATAGTGCAICLAGLGGFGSGVITYCIGKANGK